MTCDQCGTHLCCCALLSWAQLFSSTHSACICICERATTPVVVPLLSILLSIAIDYHSDHRFTLLPTCSRSRTHTTTTSVCVCVPVARSELTGPRQTAVVDGAAPRSALHRRPCSGGQQPHPQFASLPAASWPAPPMPSPVRACVRGVRLSVGLSAVSVGWLLWMAGWIAGWRPLREPLSHNAPATGRPRPRPPPFPSPLPLSTANFIPVCQCCCVCLCRMCAHCDC